MLSITMDLKCMQDFMTLSLLLDLSEEHKYSHSKYIKKEACQEVLQLKIQWQDL